MTFSKVWGLASVAALVGGIGCAAPALAQSEAEFFKGKTVTLYIGSGSGGSLDQYARLVARHMGTSISGQPVIVPKNMPGAGGIAVGNYIFRVGPKDGTAIGTVAQSVPFEPLFGGKDSKAEFDSLKMHWLGSPVKFAAVAVAWHTAPVKKAEDLLSNELVVGSSGIASASTNDAYVLRNLLGFKYRVILGYPSGSDIDLAMERGETQGRANVAWEGLKNRNIDWLRDKKITLLYQEGLKKHPELPDVPLILDFAKTAEDRQILELKFSSYELGYPFFVASEVPAARVIALRLALAKTLVDPALKEEAQKQRLDVEPVTGEYIEDILHKAFSAPPAAVARYEELSKPPSQFETAKPVTVKIALVAVENDGQRIRFEDKGKSSLALVASGTEVTIGGAKAKPGALKAGMACAVTYFGDRGQAKSVTCE